LGTSSILAGAVMAVLWRASGKHFTNTDLFHAILYLEQMLTTGGGWQDQVGGLEGGIKVGHSESKLPLYIDMTKLEVPQSVIQELNERLLLVYTGKTRLAKNVLQNVIRNWYARNPVIMQSQDRLVKLAWESAQAVMMGNLDQLGECLNQYWKLKKIMAPGCEPQAVANMIEALRPHISGVCMAGAGGGGFMYIITKKPQSQQLVEDVLKTVKGAENTTIHEATIDMSGIELHIED